jgi:hypothetical protein
MASENTAINYGPMQAKDAIPILSDFNFDGRQGARRNIGRNIPGRPGKLSAISAKL